MENSDALQEKINLNMLQQKTKRKISKLNAIKIKFPNQDKVPIWLIISYLKKEKPFVIDFDQTFQQFKQGVKAKLQYDGEQSTRGSFFNIVKGKNQNGKFTITNPNILMGQLFEQYKTQIGWIQIQIKQESIF